MGDKSFLVFLTEMIESDIKWAWGEYIEHDEQHDRSCVESFLLFPEEFFDPFYQKSSPKDEYQEEEEDFVFGSEAHKREG